MLVLPKVRFEWKGSWIGVGSSVSAAKSAKVCVSSRIRIRRGHQEKISKKKVVLK